MTDTMRSEFEAWAVESHHAYRNKHGLWFYDFSGPLWRGWQAATERAARLCDAIKDDKNDFGTRTKNEFGPAIATGALLCAAAIRGTP